MPLLRLSLPFLHTIPFPTGTGAFVPASSPHGRDTFLTTFCFAKGTKRFAYHRLWLPRVRINGGVCFLGHGSTEATLRMGVLLIKWCAISLRLPTHWSTWFHFHYIYIICMYVCVCVCIYNMFYKSLVTLGWEEWTQLYRTTHAAVKRWLSWVWGDGVGTLTVAVQRILSAQNLQCCE